MQVAISGLRHDMLSHSVGAVPPKTFETQAHQQLMANPDLSKQGCKVFIGGLVRTSATLRLAQATLTLSYLAAILATLFGQIVADIEHCISLWAMTVLGSVRHVIFTDVALLLP